MTCRFCNKPSVSYYDISLTGIGNFIEYCKDHQEEARQKRDEHDKYWEEVRKEAMKENG
mgnify:CR=1 FL=1